MVDLPAPFLPRIATASPLVNVKGQVVDGHLFLDLRAGQQQRLEPLLVILNRLKVFVTFLNCITTAFPVISYPYKISVIVLSVRL